MPFLTDLMEAYPGRAEMTDACRAVAVTALTADSTSVTPGAMFFALRGAKQDGAAFIPDARAKGAAAALCAMDSAAEAGEGFCVVRVDNPRLALARIASAFYAPQPRRVAAVTGTDGKTSTAEFFRQLCTLSGHKAASLGTLGTIGEHGETLIEGSHTTPDPVALHRTLHDLAAQGYDDVGMEASSHGLDQYRLDGVRVMAAAFTNLTRDHLDYHGSEHAYFAAKRRLFSDLLAEGGTAVLNADDAHCVELRTLCTLRGCRIITFGREEECDYRITDLRPLPEGQHVTLSIRGKRVEQDIPLVGDFQIMNMLAAVGLITGCGGDEAQALTLLPKLRGVPGRLERVATLKNGACVYVDYAHTPAALAKALTTLRPHTQGKLHVVFGAGGDRDKGKRPQMGHEAAAHADVIIVTDDNPRSEDPKVIRAAIMEACPKAKEIGDRREAIFAAVRALKKGDVLLLAGKGHEKVQIVGKVLHPFNDADVARQAAGAK